MTGLDCFVGLLERQGRRPHVNSNGAGRALCPSHDDHSPSLEFRRADKHSGVIATCRSCPATLEQMLRDLGADDSETCICTGRLPKPAPLAERSWIYRDAQGVPRFRSVRIPPTRPGAKKTFILQRSDGVGGWVKGLKKLKTFPYRLPETLAAIARDDTIWIAEGEKNVDDLVDLGLEATCNPMGATKWYDSCTASLPGLKRVVICADNDTPGAKQVHMVVDSLLKAGVTDITVLDFPGVDGRDVSDWLLEQPAADRKARLLDYLKANGHAPSRNGTPPADPTTPAPPPSGGARRPRPLTDSGNAERLEDRHGHELRYYEPEKTWLMWNGQRWVADAFAALDLSITTLRSIDAEVAALDDPDKRKAFRRWADRCESESARNAMVSLARGPLRVDADELDANPWTLNVENGIVDLKTGMLSPHRRDAMMTKLVAVPFDPSAQHQVWDRFLDRMVPDPEVRAFLQRAVGYSLTGDTSEEKLFFIHGPTASGKSTFMAALNAVFGDYACTCNFETFLENKSGMNAATDLARLPGVRMAVSLEVDEGRKLAVGLLKTVTGRDQITTRHFYKGWFTYTPTFKLWLVANDKPRANASDAALWRRILMIPFEESLPVSEQDPGVKTTLTTDPLCKAAILAWAALGTQMWLRDGLQPPEAVERATSDYRKEEDSLGDFLDDCCVLGIELSVTKPELRKAYEAWSAANGERPLGSRALLKRLVDHGVKSERKNTSRLWVGLRLKESIEQTDAFR